jgi:hypothetical protein
MASSLGYKHVIRHKNSYKTAPAHTPVVDGNFPVFENFKELAVYKLNRFLTSLLVVAVIISMVSYSVVAAKENKINTIHEETNEINYENLELQNRVDSVKSFYSINAKIDQASWLTKPDSVLEVNAVTPDVNNDNQYKNTGVKTVLGY